MYAMCLRLMFACVQVLKVRNEKSNRPKGGACRVEWDVGRGHGEVDKVWRYPSSNMHLSH